MNALANLRELGSLSATNFVYKQRYNNMKKFKMAKHISFEEAIVDMVLSLDIEHVDDRYMLCMSENRTVAIYDLANSSGKLPFKCEVVALTEQEETRIFHKITAKVQWFPFYTGIFITSNRDKSIHVWDSNEMEKRTSFVLPKCVSTYGLASCASFSTVVAVATTSPKIILVDIMSKEYLQELRGLQIYASSVVWSPKYEYLIAAGTVDGKIHLWDLRSARGVLKTLPSAHDYPVSTLKFTSDGLHLVSQRSDNSIELWNADTFENVGVNYAIQRDTTNEAKWGYRLKTFEVCCNMSQPLLFVPNNYNDLQVFDLHTGTKHETVLGPRQLIHCIGYRASAQELYSGGSYAHGRLMAWSSEIDEEVKREFMPQAVDRPSRFPFPRIF